MIVSRLSFRHSSVISSVLLAISVLVFSDSASAQQESDRQNVPGFSPIPSRLVKPIDDTVTAPLRGNVRQDVLRAPDLGSVEDEEPLHLFLLLQRSAAQQADLENLIARQQQQGTPEYHKWLTPAEFGARFGASSQDIGKLSGWLESQGFSVRGVLHNGSMIDFDANAGQVREAFHSQLHYVSMRGGKYTAAIQDPQIPAALATVVAGIKGLNKIPPRTNHTEPHQSSRDPVTHSWQMTSPRTEDMVTPAFNAGGGYYLVSPQDLYTIYKVNPVFAGGNLAANATVAVIEETDIEYGTVNSGTGVATGGDIATFRSLFGVPGALNMHVYHGYGSVTCSDPGVVSTEDVEATLDAEWINATAPSANLIFMSCDNTTDDGIFTSMAALIDNNLADVMSLSYGESEQYYTTSDYTFQDNLFAQAAAQGQSIVISSGDSGSDVRDQNTTGTATHGINVSAFAAPLVTVTGGTDFQDLYDALEGGPPQSAYWSSTNSGAYGDALGYVPEMPWNDSCAGSILSVYEGYTGAGLCGANSFTNGDVVGGSGGISTHYAVPSWQSGISGYSNSMHSQPDISGIAADGFWGHYLVFCDSSPTHSGSYDCSSTSTFGGAGGTSFVAPYMAGIFGLLRAATGSRQGLLNPTLYALAKAQFTSPSTQTACYANGQASNTGVTTGLPASTCIFNDVTTGNNDVPCASGRLSCYVNSGKAYGMLSLTGSSSLSVAYPSAVGYDQVTGIGTVNVANLIAGWNTAFASSTTLQANPTIINASQSTQLTATVTGGTPTGYVDTPPPVTGTMIFKAGATVVGTCMLSAGTCSTFVPGSSLQSGTNSMTAVFGGSGTYPSSTSSAVSVTVQNGSPTPLTPYIQVNNGGWQQTNTVTVSPGSTVNLGEQVLTGGSYSWSGPGGYNSTSRIASNVPLTSAGNSFTLTYTNTAGATSTATFTVNVGSTPLIPYIQVNNGGWQQTNTVTVSPGSTVNLGEQVLTGGSYSWSGPGGYNSTSRIASNVPLTSAGNSFTLTYTNTAGATSTATFTVNVGSTPLTPWIQVNNGGWQQTNTVTVSPGSTVNLGEQVLTGGSYSWSGSGGYSSTSRIASNVPLASASNSFTLTYTNTAGATSTATFTVNVGSTPLIPYIQVNNGGWQQTNTVTVSPGSTVNLGEQVLTGGSYSWSGPGGYNSTSRIASNVPLTSAGNSFTLTYTNTAGATSTATFTVNVGSTPLTPWIQVNNGGWQQTNTVTVSPGSTVNLGEQVLTGGSYSWSGPGGYSSTSRIASNVPLTSTSNIFTLTYTNTAGATSSQSFTVTFN